MSAKWQRVEKEGSQVVTGEVIVIALHAAREDQPVTLDIACLRFSPQLPHGIIIAPREPQYAAFHRAEQLHPHVEHRRRNLVTIVERTKHKAPLWQAFVRAHWNLVSNF